MKNTLISLFVVGAALCMPTANAADAEALFKSKLCAACHSADAKVVGPALKDVAAKYAGVDGAADTLADHIKNGTSGHWGGMAMPPNPVTEEEAKTLAEWVLNLK